jgi:hypothetical protein
MSALTQSGLGVCTASPAGMIKPHLVTTGVPYAPPSGVPARIATVACLSLGVTMRRRDFIKVIGIGTVGWPLAARAQQPAIPVVGYLSATSQEGGRERAAAFRGGLQQSGYVEGQNVTIEYRWADE